MPPRGSGGCALHPGDQVRLRGLKANAAWNGKEGTCERWSDKGRRMYVRLSRSDVKGFRPRNLRKVRAASEEDATATMVKEVFRRFDANGDGVLDTDQFGSCLQALGLDPRCLDMFLHSVDKDNDGLVLYEDFVDWAIPPTPAAAPLPAWKSELNAQDGEEEVTCESSDSSDSESSEDEELSIDDLKKLVGKFPDSWPPNGITVVNNMHARFPEYPVQGIMMMMIHCGYHGGNVMHAIRLTGAMEVEVNPPIVVCPSMFPSEYKVLRGEELKVFEQGCRNWSFKNMLTDKLEAVGMLHGDNLFQVLEVRRGTDYAFCYGRVAQCSFRRGAGLEPEVSVKEGGALWIVLGLENKVQALKTSDLNFTSAHRMS